MQSPFPADELPTAIAGLGTESHFLNEDGVENVMEGSKSAVRGEETDAQNTADTSEKDAKELLQQEAAATGARPCGHQESEVERLRRELAEAKRHVESLQSPSTAPEVAEIDKSAPATDIAIVLAAPTPASTGIQATQKNIWGMYSSSVLQKQGDGCFLASPTRGARALGSMLRRRTADMPLAVMDIEARATTPPSGAVGAAGLQDPIEVVQARKRNARARSRAAQVAASLLAEQATHSELADSPPSSVIVIHGVVTDVAAPERLGDVGALAAEARASTPKRRRILSKRRVSRLFRRSLSRGLPKDLQA